jgi:DNA primase
MIPQDTVQKIIETADIVEVVGDFVTLKKRGANMIACCPFHNEKTPSFSVSPSKGIYKCFGCGQGGDSVRFVMELEGLSYPDALKWLAKKYNIEIVEREVTNEDIAAQNEKESLYIALEYAEKTFIDYLLKSEDGQSVGMSYYKERGFSNLTIEKFGLGFTPDQKTFFYQKAQKAGFSDEILIKAGLINKKENGDIVDRFRGRVIFPIHNVAGKPIAFGARILKTDPKAPKYINSPETEIYIKSNIVYGIAQAKKSIKVLDNCFLVEGYTDVVSMHQAGIENVVASSGTSLTTNQVRLIKRFTNNITVLYDGDAAGIKASLRGFDIILEEDMNVRAVVFPDGDDPDSYIKKVGSELFKEYINTHQQDFIQFKTKLILSEIENDPVKKAELIQDLVNTIVKIPTSIKRSVYYSEVSKLLNIDELILINEANKLLGTKIIETKRVDGGGIIPAPPSRNLEVELLEKNNQFNNQEEALVKDLVIYGHIILEKDEEANENFTLADYLLNETSDLVIDTPVLKDIYEIYKDNYLQKNNTVNLAVFTSNTNEFIQKTVINWLSSKHLLSEHWKKYEIFIPDYSGILDEISYKMVLRIRMDKTKKDIAQLTSEIEKATEDDVDILLDQIAKKQLILRHLAEELGSVV